MSDSKYNSENNDCSEHKTIDRSIAISKITLKEAWTGIALAFLLSGVFFALTLLWFSFDYHLPLQDEARHILNSMAARDLLIRFRPWQYDWWCRCLTVDAFYPPVAYFVNGSFLLVLGQSRFIEQVYMSFYTGLLVLSTYGLTWLLGGTRRAACIAGICVAVYPAVSGLGHTFYLELPELSMTSFALMMLFWWRSSPNPSVVRTIVTGFAVGAACLNKQLVAAYVLPVGLYFLAADLKQAFFPLQVKGSTNRFVSLIHTLSIGVITTLIGLPFLLVSYQSNRSYTASNLEVFASKGMDQSFIYKLVLYVHLMPATMSPLLFATFLGAILILRRREYLCLAPIVVSAVGGLCLSCLWPGMGHDYRYLIPFLIASATFSGFFLEKLLASGNLWWQSAAVIVISLALSNYCMYNFSPYPLFLPHLPWQSYRSEYSGKPAPYADWGHSFVFETIKQVDGNTPVYLNLLTNFGGLHVQGFQLFLKEHGNSTIIPTSSRVYTIVGDKVSFDPTAALYHHWYLWKTGYVGYPLYDEQSEGDFTKLVQFVRSSGNYKLIASKKMPDGGDLMLYRRRF